MASHRRGSPAIPITAPPWHAFDAQSIVETVQTDPHSGLSTPEAAGRLERYGPNTLKTVGKGPWYVVFVAPSSSSPKR
jgi:magnesium-transporting ATPase (P-type)